MMTRFLLFHQTQDTTPFRSSHEVISYSASTVGRSSACARPAQSRANAIISREKETVICRETEATGPKQFRDTEEAILHLTPGVELYRVCRRAQSERRLRLPWHDAESTP